MKCPVQLARDLPAKGGLAQTSLFEVCDAPKGHFKERRSALASMPDKSLQEIADPTNQGSAPACGTVPWTLEGLAAVFGMGTDVSPPVWAPGTQGNRAVSLILTAASRITITNELTPTVRRVCSIFSFIQGTNS